MKAIAATHPSNSTFTQCGCQGVEHPSPLVGGFITLAGTHPHQHPAPVKPRIRCMADNIIAGAS